MQHILYRKTNQKYGKMFDDLIVYHDVFVSRWFFSETIRVDQTTVSRRWQCLFTYQKYHFKGDFIYHLKTFFDFLSYR